MSKLVRAEHIDEEGQGIPLWVPIAVLGLFGSVLCLLIVAAIFVTKYHTILLILAGLDALVTLLAGGWFIMTLMNRPPEVIHHHETRTVVHEVPVMDDKAARAWEGVEAIGAIDKDAGREAGSILAHILKGRWLGLGSDGVETSDTHASADIADDDHESADSDKPGALDKVIDFLKSASGVALITELIQSYFGSKKGDGGEGGEGGGGVRISSIIWACGCAVPICCILVVGGLYGVIKLRNRPAATDTDTPTLIQPTLIPVGGAPTNVVPPTPTPFSSVTNPPTPIPSGNQISIGVWTVPCQTSDPWCFGGYTTEGNVHLYAWLKNEIAAQCTVPASDTTWATWTQNEWEAATGHFFPLRDWYHTGYDSPINLVAEKAGICSAFGGTAK